MSCRSLLKFRLVSLFSYVLLFTLVAVSCRAESVTPKPELKFPLPAPTSVGAEEFCRLLNLFITQGGYKNWKHERQPHATGPFILHDSGLVESFGTHGPAAVQVYFSPEVWKWMEGGNKGVIADGGMIVKLLYERNMSDPEKFSIDPTGFSIMVKDSQGSWDGWFYSDGGPLQKPTPESALTFFDANAGFAVSCMNCHASADNPESTYSSKRGVAGAPIFHKTIVSKKGLEAALKGPNDIHAPASPAAPALPPLQLDKIPRWPYASGEALTAPLVPPAPLVSASYDHLPQGPRPDGQRAFVTASNCMACHDAVQLYSVLPNMAIREDSGTKFTNLSPYGEWRYSLMGLSGRDPVFFAQLESEKLLHPSIAEQIDTTCLSCHSPMGQRQFKQDFGADSPFNLAALHAPQGDVFEKYGVLGRDGVSCLICHTMEPKGMGAPSTYTGRFKLAEKHSELFGPYDKVATLPMETALGITPKHGPHIQDSKLCASCHTVTIPSLQVGRNYSVNEFKTLFADAQEKPHHHEQSTYLEWKNSRFTTEEKSAERSVPGRTCQDCHMPRKYNGLPLTFKSANIEDDSFPPVDHRASNAQLHLEPRERFARHALHGINVFTLELFNQHPTVLGVQRFDNLFPAPETQSGFDVALGSMRRMAAKETALVELLNVTRSENLLRADVKVANLTGHKFPTGVSFRRAFIEFTVKDGDKILWQSGGTDAWGVIGTGTGENFAPLQSEFLTHNSHQPHYKKITREDQVQIYEQLIADGNGDLTTSFLHQHEVVKDNRLLPAGWTQSGPDAALTRPIGTSADSDYEDGKGAHTLTYEIPLPANAGKALSITATLYYQSLPPYYLQQRFNFAGHPESQRLYYLIQTLDRKRAVLEGWKLEINRASKKVE